MYELLSHCCAVTGSGRRESALSISAQIENLVLHGPWSRDLETTNQLPLFHQLDWKILEGKKNQVTTCVQRAAVLVLIDPGWVFTWLLFRRSIWIILILIIELGSTICRWRHCQSVCLQTERHTHPSIHPSILPFGPINSQIESSNGIQPQTQVRISNTVNWRKKIHIVFQWTGMMKPTGMDWPLKVAEHVISLCKSSLNDCYWFRPTKAFYCFYQFNRFNSRMNNRCGSRGWNDRIQSRTLLRKYLNWIISAKRQKRKPRKTRRVAISAGFQCHNLIHPISGSRVN